MKLTRNNTAVSYRQPVMVDESGAAYGPADLYPNDPLGRTCAQVLVEIAGHLPPDQYEMAVPFCRLVGIDIGLVGEPALNRDLRDEFWDKDADGNYIPNK